MDKSKDMDIVKLNELLKRSGEFIAYFELAEQKMQQWRDDLDAKQKNQENQIHQQFEKTKMTLKEIETLFSQAGIARFNLHMQSVEAQNKAHIDAIHKAERQLFLKAATHLRQIQQSEAQAIDSIQTLMTSSLKTLNERLNTSHLKTETVISARSKRPLLKVWGSTLACALMVGFGVSLYLTDEMPWEIHQHAKAERIAGKILQKAWPRLTAEEKNKILVENNAPLQHIEEG